MGRTFDVGPLVLWPTVGVGYDGSRLTGPFGAGRQLTHAASGSLELDVVVPFHRDLVFDVGPVLAYRHVWSNDGSSDSYDQGSAVNLAMQAHLGVTIP